MVAFAMLVELGGCGGGMSPANTAAPPAANALLAPGRHAIDVGGVSLSFEVRGSGAPCFVLPGGPGFDASYLHDMAIERSFTAVYVDPIGTGQSGTLATDEKYSTALDVESIETLRKALGIDKACLLGHSYGGTVAQRYAIEHPDTLRALIFYAATPVSDKQWIAQLMTNVQRFKDKPWFADIMRGIELDDTAKNQAELDESLRLVLPLYVADWDRESVRLRPLIEHTKLVFDVYKRRKTSTDQDRRPALANVKVPTLVIAGELDTLNGPLPASWFASAMPQATIVIVPGAGHLVHLEQPEAFDRAIETFAKTLH